MNKRGISAIVATVLIILITVASVTILWAAIIPMIQDNLDFSSLKGRVSVVTSGGYTYYDENMGIASVQVKRDVDDEVMDKIRIAFSFAGNEVSSSVVAPLSGQTKAYLFDLSDFGKPESVSVAPIFSVGNKERVGASTSDVIIKKFITSSSTSLGTVSSGTVYSLGEDYTFDIGEGLVAYWRLDGNTEDSVGHYDLVELNGASFNSVDGRSGADFSMDDSRMSYSPGQDLSPDENSFTYAFWIYFRNFTHPDCVNPLPHCARFLQQDNWCPGNWPQFPTCTWFDAQVYSNGHIFFGGKAHGTTTSFGIHSEPNTISLNKWHHVAYVLDRTNNMQHIYINGSNYKSASANNYLNEPIGSLNMTASYALGSSWGTFNGLIDEAMIYYKALNAEEIKNLYDTQKD